MQRPFQPDETTFEQLAPPLRGQLLAYAYKMTGSYSDAEDIVQNSLLRAWNGYSQLLDKTAFRKWLYQITTNETMRLFSKRKRRFVPAEIHLQPNIFPGQPREESLWLEPFPMDSLPSDSLSPADEVIQREQLEFAFVHALQTLTPLQRGAFLLQVAGLTLDEIAESLGSTATAISSALQRARARLESRPRKPMLPLDRAILNQYVRAWLNKDIALLTQLLADDIEYSMPPWAEWYSGRESVAQFFGEAWLGYDSFTAAAVSLNCLPGVMMWTKREKEWQLHSLHLAQGGQEIENLMIFRGEEVLRRFAKHVRLPDSSD